MAKENRKYKDSVFCDLFYSDRDAQKNLLELYNALFHDNLDDPSEIRMIRLEDAIFMNMKNDVAFSVMDKRIVLSEHQSTVNPNMPVRMLMYIAREYEKIIPSDTRYSRRLCKIPKPEFFVFYNGKDDCPQEQELMLSEAYADDGDAHVSLELKVRVININTVKGHPILRQCSALLQYSRFVERVRDCGDDKNALNEAVRGCIRDGILQDYLRRKGSEVINMLIDEYDYERDIEVKSREAAETAAAQAFKKGVEKGVEKGIEKGENRFGLLMSILFSKGRTEDAERAASDSVFRNELLKEFGIS